MAGLPVRIGNGGSGQIAKVYKPLTTDHGSGEAGLMVYTHPREEFDGVNKVFFNSTNSLAMNVDGSIVPSITDVIYTDAAQYPAVALSGTWDFASAFTGTGWPPDGTVSVDATATVNNDEAEFTRGSNLDLTSYDAIAGCIYVTSWPTSGTKQVLVELRDSSDLVIGVPVDIGGYINVSDFNVAQEWIIPLADLSATNQTIRKVIIRTVDIGGGQAPNYYLDDMRFQDGGNGFSYEIAPSADKTLFVDRVTIQIEDVYNVTSSNQNAVGMSGILGESTLTNGIQAGLEINGAKPSALTATFKDLRNWVIFPQIKSNAITTFGDGINTTLRFELSFEEIGGLRLRPRYQEKLFYTIQDDLSGLVFFQIWADCHEVFDDTGEAS